MRIDVDLRSRTPIYEQLVERIRELALRGEALPDEKLPSVRQLSLELGINPNTIQKAYAELERAGVIYSVAGKGSFVVPDTVALSSKHRAQTEQRLRALLLEAKESGVELDVIRKIVLETYEGGGED